VCLRTKVGDELHDSWVKAVDGAGYCAGFTPQFAHHYPALKSGVSQVGSSGELNHVMVTWCFDFDFFIDTDQVGSEPMEQGLLCGLCLRIFEIKEDD
jgi:hypothetical protein